MEGHSEKKNEFILQSDIVKMLELLSVYLNSTFIKVKFHILKHSTPFEFYIRLYSCGSWRSSQLVTTA